jgi:hypothetical protein
MKHVSSLRKALFALLFVGCVGSSQATVVFSTTGGFAGDFDQVATYTFTIGTAGSYLATLSDSLPPITGLELLISLTGSATPLVDLLGPGTQTFDALSIGSYTALVFGHPTARPSGIFGGSYGVVVETNPAPIPEPAVWLMMMGGIGLLGWLRLRKSENLA